MKIRVINKSKHELPGYSTEASAGMDLRANLQEDILLRPMERIIVPTGLFLEIPVGYEAQIRPGSDLAIKKGITVLNSSGSLDADYHGEVCIILVNLSKEIFVVKDGEKICQMVIAKHEKAEWISVESMRETERVEGGFGHKGKE